MNRPDPSDTDIDRLLGDLEAPVPPSDEFRRSLIEELRRRLAHRRGEGGLPEGWALCPFTAFCIAEQRVPRIVGANCPCLHAAPALKLLSAHGLPLHPRPCTGLRLRAETGVAPPL
jgi:hypothetical protein